MVQRQAGGRSGKRATDEMNDDDDYDGDDSGGSDDDGEGNGNDYDGYSRVYRESESDTTKRKNGETE